MGRHEPNPDYDEKFTKTHWSWIAVAKGSDVTEARKALAGLCESYWYPLYTYLRRRGHRDHQARDLTQGFFASLLEHDFLGKIDPDKGRFRSFLLASLQHYVANQHDRDRARKRGGGAITFSIDLSGAEGRYAREPEHELTAERLFERRWALTLLERVLDQLRAEMSASEKGPLFDQLGPALLGGGAAAPYAAIGAELGMSVGAVKVAAHRLRRRYRELIRDEVARTVEGPDDIEEEIRALFVALSR